MKLETKFQDNNFDFGEIVKAKVTTYYDENKVVVMADRARGVSRFEYNSIKDFTDDWEDAPEEPKEHWYISADGDVRSEPEHQFCDPVYMKIIGNYFETKEEAEKAVDKLKAWKRLKDKGFDIESWDTNIGDDYYKTGQIVLNLNNVKNREWDEYTQINEIKNDLDLLFSQEDEE